MKQAPHVTLSPASSRGEHNTRIQVTLTLSRETVAMLDRLASVSGIARTRIVDAAVCQLAGLMVLIDGNKGDREQ